MQRSEALKEAQNATGMRIMQRPGDGLELYYLDGENLRLAGTVRNPGEALIFMDAWLAAHGQAKVSAGKSDPSRKPGA